MQSLYLDGLDSQLHATNRLNPPLLHIIDMSKRFLIKSLLYQHLHSFLQHAKRHNLSPKAESQRPTFYQPLGPSGGLEVWKRARTWQEASHFVTFHKTPRAFSTTQSLCIYSSIASQTTWTPSVTMTSCCTHSKYKEITPRLAINMERCLLQMRMQEWRNETKQIARSCYHLRTCTSHKACNTPQGASSMRLDAFILAVAKHGW